jgi:hypothetical protein
MDAALALSHNILESHHLLLVNQVRGVEMCLLIHSTKRRQKPSYGRTAC